VAQESTIAWKENGMRWLNTLAALSGAAALIALASARHLCADADMNALLMAALVQFGAAAAGLAIAARSGRLSAIAGGMIVAGAALFAGEIYFSAFTGSHAFIMLAPLGGGLTILGWLALAFAKPRD
jgi:uncharacterized membrane protein YgdD (TMEM256/DUF423 family)